MIPPVAKLNLEINNILNPSWEKPFSTGFYIKNFDTFDEWITIFKPCFIDKLHSILPITRIMIFNKPANWSEESAHIDPNVLFALNIIHTLNHSLIKKAYQNTESYMEWFSIKEGKEKPINYSDSNTPYIKYDPKEIDLIHKECLDSSAAIVRTDIPHRIKIGYGHRTCYSFRFSNNFKDWSEVVNFYKNIGWIFN